MTTHTPGPWQEGRSGNNRVYGPDKQGSRSGLIAVVYKGRANARLIAAAPETAAERDRLKAINAELVLFAQQAETVFKDIASGIKRSCWEEMYQKAHAVRTKAQSSK